MSVLSFVITGVLTTLIVLWLQSEQRRSPRVDAGDGSFELRHGGKYRWIAVTSLVLVPGSFLVVALTGDVSGSANVLGFAALFVILTLIALWMVVDAFKTRVVVNSDGITVRTPVGGVRSLKWTEIRTISYNPWAGWLSLKSEGHPTIRFQRHLLGADALITRLREETGAETFRGFARLLVSVGKDAA